MTRLDQFASNDDYTLDGEAGIIAHIFDHIGPGSKVAVEFGAGDGESCSNTAQLWRNQEWQAVLVEPNPGYFQDLEGNANPFNTICQQKALTPTGPDSISALLDDLGIGAVDFMSIDVDGDDYLIFQGMTCRPRVVCIEFNPTVPSHIALRQTELGQTFGSSLLSIVRLGISLGYRFVGASRCNAFFVIEAEAGPFNTYETNPETLFPVTSFTYAVTDYLGRVVLCGQPLPWQAKEPYVLPLDASTNVIPITVSPQHIRRGFESLWGPAMWVSSASPNGLTQRLLNLILKEQRPPLVCVDLSNEAPETKAWLLGVGEPHNYKTIVAGPVMGLIQQEEK